MSYLLDMKQMNYNIQCSRAMQPNFLFSWPNARVGVASGDHIDGGTNSARIVTRYQLY